MGTVGLLLFLSMADDAWLLQCVIVVDLWGFQERRGLCVIGSSLGLERVNESELCVHKFCCDLLCIRYFRSCLLEIKARNGANCAKSALHCTEY